MLLTVGYMAGRYREGTEISNSLVPPLVIGGLTTAAAAGFAAIELMLGVRTPVSLLVLREIVVQGLLAVVLAIPFYPLIRRLLRPAIVDDFQAPARAQPDLPGRRRGSSPTAAGGCGGRWGPRGRDVRRARAAA